MKIRPMAAKLFHADRQKDMTKQPVYFRNFANALKNEHKHSRSEQKHSYSEEQNVENNLWHKCFIAACFFDYS